MQLVFEFGSSEARSVVEAIRHTLGKSPYNIKCLPTAGMDYESTDDTVEAAEAKLVSGEISAFSIHPQQEMIRYALVLKPFFDGRSLSLCLGTIEYTGRDYVPIWNLLLNSSGLTLACLGFEDGVELEDAQLTLETFPWNSWPLVVGALRDPSKPGPWIIREGPEMRWFKQVPG